MIRALADSLLTLVYPQSCYVCGKSVELYEHGALCGKCWDETCIFEGNETLCEKCGRFLRDRVSDKTTFCHRCDEHFYDKARAIGKYEKALSGSILSLKREPVISKYLQDLIVEAFHSTSFQNTTKIVPVPLSKRRYIDRGFNQALVISKVLSKATGIPADDKSLSRKKHTRVHRVGMDKRGRELSVEQAFEVKREKLITGENILLVDDVFTSGATASACSKVLKKKGAAIVNVFTIAHTG